MAVGREPLLLQLLRGKPLLPAEVGVLLEGGQRLSGSSEALPLGIARRRTALAGIGGEPSWSRSSSCCSCRSCLELELQELELQI